MSRPVRVAVIGTGNVSDMHFAGLVQHPDRVEVVAAVDPLAARLERAAQLWGVPDGFASVDDLLAGCAFDVAVVCTPSGVRVETVGALAAAGKHMLVEKPMADTMADAVALVQICRDAGVKLAVDQNFRDHYCFGIAAGLIAQGQLGTIFGIDHHELMFRPVVGWRAEAVHNSLAVMGVHWFDGFRLLLPQEADRVLARTYSSAATPSAGDTDAFLQIRFGEATVNYTQSFSSRFERIETLVFGEQATLAFDYDTLRIRTTTGEEHVFTNEYAGDGKPESAYRSLERLLDAVDAGAEPTNGGADNLKTLSLLFAAYESSETGLPVDLDDGMLR